MHLKTDLRIFSFGWLTKRQALKLAFVANCALQIPFVILDKEQVPRMSIEKRESGFYFTAIVNQQDAGTTHCVLSRCLNQLVII